MECNARTGYPSIDRPWLKYYSEEVRNTELPKDTLYNISKKSNKNNLNGIALNYYGRKISYGELFNIIDDIASALENSGIHKNSIVSICMLNSPETIYLLLALNKIGAVANMICGLDTPAEINRYLIDAESKVVFVLDLFQDKISKSLEGTQVEKVIVSKVTNEMSITNKIGAVILSKVKKIPLIDDDRFVSWTDFRKKSNGQSSTVEDPDAPAFITYTGGTTGGSKGVVLSNSALLAVSKQYLIGEDNTRNGNKWMLVLPLFIAFGVICVAVPFMSQRTIIIRLPMGESIAEICKKFKPNYFVYSPAFWESFADQNCKIDLSALISPISGGDQLTNKAETKINSYLKAHGCNTPIMNGYGMSEVCAAVAVNYKHIYEFGSVGAPFVKNIISAFDPNTGQELTYGQEGEICIHTPSMMIGYLKNQEETENIIRRHDDGLLWVHSGDLGYISERGFVHISGRLKRYFLTFNNGAARKVFSLDIEKKLLQHPLIQSCVAVPVDDPIKNQVPVAFVILSKEVCPNEETESILKQYIDEHLDILYRPVRLYFVNQFPHTKVGKVDYRALEREAAEKMAE